MNNFIPHHLPPLWLLNDIDQRLWCTVRSFDPLMWLRKLAVWQLVMDLALHPLARGATP